MTDKRIDLSCISEESDFGCFESVIGCNLDTAEVYIEVGDKITHDIDISDIHCVCISNAKSVYFITNTSVYPEGTDIDKIKDYEYVYRITFDYGTSYYVASDLYINKYINFKCKAWILFGDDEWKLTKYITCIQSVR